MSEDLKPRVRVTTAGFTRKIIPPKPPAAFRTVALYEAAGGGKRAESWSKAGNYGPVSLLGRSLDTLRNRCRFECRNNPTASRVVDFIVGKVVGNGLRPSLRAGIEDPAFNRLVEDWMEQCDADEVSDFYGLQELVMRNTVTAGDACARFRERDPVEDAHLAVPMQIQLVPGEMLPSIDPTGESVSGIIFKGPGRRSAYKFLKQHPGERLNGAAVEAGFSYVPAEKVAHVFWQRDIGQVRGEPWLVRGLIPLHDLDAYQDAELVRKKMAAMPVFWIQTPVDTQRPQGPASYAEDGTPLDAEGNAWVAEDPVELMPDLQPGAVVPVPPGYQVNPSLPADVGGQYDVFVRRQLQRVCQAVSVPYELVTGDTPSGANERMMRVRIHDFYSLVRQWRRMLVRSFCQPAWRSFVQAAYDSGKWTPVSGYTIEDYKRVDWIGEPPAHTHPEQEVNAELLAVRGRLKSRSQVIRERGGDPEQVFRQIADEHRLAADLGIRLEDDPDLEMTVEDDPDPPASPATE